MGLSGGGAAVDDRNSDEASRAGLIVKISLLENALFPEMGLKNPLTRPPTSSKDLGGAVGNDRLYKTTLTVPDIANGSRHIVELQSLRGIAASVVVVFHCMLYYGTPNQFGLIRDILFNGQGAVVIFFVMSGFVLGRSLINQKFSYLSVATFYLKRAFRIYPALWVASSISLGYLMFIHYKSPHPFASMWFLTRFKVERMRPLHIAASLAGMLAFLLPPLWTIFNEIVGSILLPFAARLSVKKNYAIILTTTFLFLAVSFGPRTYYGFGLFLLDFQIGLDIALVVSSGRFSKWSGRKGWGAAFMIGAATLVCGRGLVAAVVAPNLWMFDPAMHLVELGAASVMIASITIGGLSLPLLRRPAFTLVGDYSYSVYLLHFPIMCLYATVIDRFIGSQNETVFWSLVLGALTLITVWFAAGVVYRAVEVPFIRLGRQACLRLGGSMASSTVAA